MPQTKGAKKKSKPSVDKTTVESEPDPDDIVTYDGEQEPEMNIDLTNVSEATLQE